MYLTQVSLALPACSLFFNITDVLLWLLGPLEATIAEHIDWIGFELLSCQCKQALSKSTAFSPVPSTRL